MSMGESASINESDYSSHEDFIQACKASCFANSSMPCAGYVHDKDAGLCYPVSSIENQTKSPSFILYELLDELSVKTTRQETEIRTWCQSGE